MSGAQTISCVALAVCILCFTACTSSVCSLRDTWSPRRAAVCEAGKSGQTGVACDCPLLRLRGGEEGEEPKRNANIGENEQLLEEFARWQENLAKEYEMNEELIRAEEDELSQLQGLES
eukprot:1051966-Rhodomonas_salina.3